jgi:hypothetical protein
MLFRRGNRKKSTHRTSLIWRPTALYSTPVCGIRHMSHELSLTILTLKWLRKEHSRSLKMALFCRNM